MRIVFFGTPTFAVPSLDALVGAGHDMRAVVTQPDRPSGRGGRIDKPPVKHRAAELGLPVLQFEKARSNESVGALAGLGADMFVTAAYGQILSRRMLAIPPQGTVNVHASLLPAYRGPAPVQWAIMNGEIITGVTTMMTDAGVDTGDILLQRSTDIGTDETAGELLEKLSHVGASLLTETIERIERGDCPRVLQDESLATRHPMLDKSHERIDWTKGARSVRDQIRALTPAPGAMTSSPNGSIKIWSASVCDGEGKPGEVIISDAKRGLVVACGSDALSLGEIQAQGGKRMDARAYLRGHEVPIGAILGEENT